MNDKRKPWCETLPIHQAAELTPLMTPEQLRELADDIKKNGMREPISISDFERDRYRALYRAAQPSQAAAAAISNQRPPICISGSEVTNNGNINSAHF